MNQITARPGLSGRLTGAELGALLRTTPAILILYLALITAAEYVTAAINPRLGLPIHAFILIGLIVHGARTTDGPLRQVLWGLTLGPLIRILSLSLPLGGLPFMSWFAIISVPVFAAAFMTARVLGYTWRDLGLVMSWRGLPVDLLMFPLGVIAGIGEYLILQPQTFVRNLTLPEIWLPILILTISTGFEEEFIFRGLLQHGAAKALGLWPGILYVTTLFAVLHIGYLSFVDLVYVFVAGGVFAIIAWKRRSIFGVTLAHGGVNTGLFVVWPFLWPILTGQGG